MRAGVSQLPASVLPRKKSMASKRGLLLSLFPGLSLPVPGSAAGSRVLSSCHQNPDMAPEHSAGLQPRPWPNLRATFCLPACVLLPWAPEQSLSSLILYFHCLWPTEVCSCSRVSPAPQRPERPGSRAGVPGPEERSRGPPACLAQQEPACFLPGAGAGDTRAKPANPLAEHAVLWRSYRPFCI